MITGNLPGGGGRRGKKTGAGVEKMPGIEKIRVTEKTFKRDGARNRLKKQSNEGDEILIEEKVRLIGVGRKSGRRAGEGHVLHRLDRAVSGR